MKTSLKCVLWSLLLTLAASPLFAQSASEILTATGISHGLCVRVGTTDGALETSLSGNGNLLVYGLALPNVDVKAVRENISNAGLGGVVSIDQAASFTKLPFANNLVNLLIVDKDALGAAGSPSMEEMERVVSPFGAYYVKEGGSWTVTKVHMKAGMAEWGQNFGTETNNNQINDTLVDVPNSIQWLADVDAASASKPRSGFRISNGMTFYFSMVKNAASNKEEVYLVCRNATNGTLIWRKPATANDVFTNKEVPIVFYNGVIYTYLSKTGFMVAIDGKTGNTIRTFSNAGKPKTGDLPNIVAANGKIYLTADKSLWALDTNGTLDWKRTFVKFVGLPSVDKTNNRVYVATASNGYKVDRDVELKGVDSLHCFNTANGNYIWKSRVRQQNTTNVVLSQLIVAENKLFYVKSGGIFMSGNDYYVWGARNLATGDSIWQREQIKSSIGQRLEATVLNGKLYSMSGGFATFDANNGSFLQRINGGNLRCPSSTATSKRLLVGFSMFGDPANNRITRRDITRSECGTLSYPSYGLLYYTTNRCQCTQGLRGASALSSEPIGAEWPLNQRLTKYITLSGSDTVKPAIWPRPNEWPAFLANAERTSSNQSQVTTLASPQLGWTVQAATPYYSKTTRVYQDWLGSDKHVGVVTSPVIADSIMVVSVQDENKIVAYDAINGGAAKWNFISGGRLLGPPTLYNGLCIFGSGDGYVYCLKLKTGALVWKFFAARNDKKVVVHGHVETPWSMPTSLLVKDNKVIVNAGYTPDSDGGVYLWALNPYSGKVIWKNLIDRPRRWYNYSENQHDEAHYTSTYLQGVNNSKLVNSLLYCDNNKVSFSNMRNFKLSDGTFTTEPMENQINYIERDPLKRNLIANWSMFYYTDNSMKTKLKGFDASSNYGRFAYISDSVVVGSRTANGISCETPDAICFENDVARVNSTNSLIYAGKNMVMCVEGTRSSVFNSVSGIVYIYDMHSGNRIATLNLPSTVISNGIVAAYGKLYLTCEDGKIYCYGTGAGEKPFAVAGNDQVKSDVGLDGTEAFYLDGSQSYAPYDSLVSYEWFKDGNLVGTGKKKMLEFAPGQHTLVLKVTSSLGLSATDTVKLFLNANYAPGGFRYLRLNLQTGPTPNDESGINEVYFYSGGVGYPQAINPRFSKTQMIDGLMKYNRSALRLVAYIDNGNNAGRIFDNSVASFSKLRGNNIMLDLTNTYAMYPDSVLLLVNATQGAALGTYGITGDSIYLYGSNDQTNPVNSLQWKKIAAYKNQIGEPTTGGSFWLINKVLARPTNAPSPLTASVNGQKVTLNWTDANTYELGFSLERKIAGGQWVQVGNLAANATSFIDSSVVSGATYTYKVCAYAGANISPYSNTVEVTIGFFISAPTNLTGLSTNIISLQWADNATNEEGYYIERKSANGTFAVIATRPANTTQYDDNTILPDSVYTYRVRAYFGAMVTAYSNSVVVNAPLSIALTPTNLTALALPGLLEVKLNWVDNAFNEDGYDIYYKAITDPNFVLTKTVVPNAVSTTLNNAPNPRFNPNTTYVFYVVATNSSGNSIQSNYDTVTTDVVSVERMVIQRHEFKVYPIPTNKNIIVEMPKLNEKLEISLIDMQGRTVYKAMESGNFDINVRGIAAGEYMLKMASLKLGISTTTLVVVSK